MSSQTADNTPRISSAEREALEVARDPVLRQMLDEERVESTQLDTALLLRLLTFLRPHRRLLSLAFALALLEALLMTAPAYVIGLAIDRFKAADAVREGGIANIFNAGADLWLQWYDDDAARALVVFFGLAVASTWLIRWFISVTTSYVVQKLGQRVVHDLRVTIYRHITGMDLTYFHGQPVGRLVNRTTFDTQAISELFSDAIAQGSRDLLFIGVLMVVMVTLDVPLALVLLSTIPVLVLVAVLYRYVARPALRTNQAVQSRMNAWLAENIAGMRENQLYRRESRRRAEFDALTQAHQRSITRVIRAWGWMRPAMLVASSMATVAILGLGYWRVTEGLITVGVMLTFVQYTTLMWRPVRSVAEKFNLIQTSLTAGERVMDVLDTATQMADDPSADVHRSVERGAVRFEDVRFAYPSKPDAEVLKGIDFDIAPGQTFALVGDTGAGKSTITHLLSRFYDPGEGLVVVDDADVRRYTLRELRRAIALVPQDVVIFATTVRENITLGADVDEETLRTCIEAVQAHHFIDRMPGGLEHVLEESGRTLSAGERQLLSFARALVANPPILVLDEATASVDTETEQRIQTALDELTRGRTSLIIAHRLSTVRDADQILVLRHGVVVERGSHHELLALDGEYARLHELHFAAQEVEKTEASAS